MADEERRGASQAGAPPEASADDSPPGDDENQRGEERVTINKEFESFDAFIHEYVTNISRSGVFVKSSKPLPVGTEVNLRFTVIMDDVESIGGIGKVVRVGRDPAGMGVVFTSLSQYSQHLIERLLTVRHPEP